MPKVAIVAALEREVSGLTKNWTRVEREHEGRSFIFFERDEMVVVCGGIGLDPARRAAEAVITLYRPNVLQSVGFAGALDASLHVGDVFAPAVVIDARDGSRTEIEGKQTRDAGELHGSSRNRSEGEPGAGLRRARRRHGSVRRSCGGPRPRNSVRRNQSDL